EKNPEMGLSDLWGIDYHGSDELTPELIELFNARLIGPNVILSSRRDGPLVLRFGKRTMWKSVDYCGCDSQKWPVLVVEVWDDTSLLEIEFAYKLAKNGRLNAVLIRVQYNDGKMTAHRAPVRREINTSFSLLPLVND